MASKPQFITIEGSEGVGKSSAVKFLRKYLQNRKLDFIATREPGGTPLAEQLRKILLEEHEEVVADVTELLMVFAGRAQHLQEVILPALNRGQWVICDRFTDATYAYQGGGREIPNDFIAQLEQMVQGSLQPDITLLLDAPLSVSTARARSRSLPDRIEKEKKEFFERVQQKYLDRAALYPQRFHIIDTNCPFTQVHKKITTVMDAFFEGYDG